MGTVVGFVIVLCLVCVWGGGGVGCVGVLFVFACLLLVVLLLLLGCFGGVWGGGGVLLLFLLFVLFGGFYLFVCMYLCVDSAGDGSGSRVVALVLGCFFLLLHYHKPRLTCISVICYITT